MHAKIPLASGGGIGVDVFFALSGFLITALLLQEMSDTGSLRFRDFYIRRVRRLLPALVAVSAFSLILFPLVHPFETRSTMLGIGSSLLYVSCWLRAFHISQLGWFGHTWSLSVEEHFYLFWPPLLALLFRRAERHLARWVLLLVAVAIGYRVAFSLAGASRVRLYNSPDMRAEQLLVGCALAVLFLRGSFKDKRWSRRLWLVLVLVSMLDLANSVVDFGSLGLSWYQSDAAVVAIESAILIGYLVLWPDSGMARFLSRPPLVWIGRRSYAVYLWHLPLFGLVDLKGEPTLLRAAARCAMIPATFLAAWASFKWVERPFYSRRAAEPSPPGHER
jgi:peptidoglycan/LPS O-acetylase OafA/YrhL